MAYILGFFAADGYITHNKRGAYFWCIQITDKDILEKIKIAIKAEHKISSRIPKRKTEKILYRLQIGSKEMCNDLYNLGFSEKKTKSLCLPNIPRKYLHDFIRGYFDGDGNIWQGEVHKESKTRHKVLQLAFTSGSHAFVNQLKSTLNCVLKTNGCHVVSGDKSYSRLQFSTKDALKIYDFMYNSCIEDSMFLRRKKRIFDKFKSMRP